MLNKVIISALATLIIAFVAVNTSVAGPAFGGGCGGKGDCGNDLDMLSDIEREDLQYMREEEKLARDIYLIMAEKHGLIIFKNIARSEDHHMAAVKNLLDKHNVEDPAENETPATDGLDFENEDLGEAFNYFRDKGLPKLMDALQVGGEIEEMDMTDIQKAIENADHADIISTYENLLCGSKNHLRAFVKQLELQGGVYTPLDPNFDFAAIVEPPIARKCGSMKKK